MLLLVILAALLVIGFFGLFWLQIGQLETKIAVLRYQSGLVERALALVDRRGAEAESLQDSLSGIFVQVEESMRVSARPSRFDWAPSILPKAGRFQATDLEASWVEARVCLASALKRAHHGIERGRACLIPLTDTYSRRIETCSVQSGTLRAGLFYALAAALLTALLAVYGSTYLVQLWSTRTRKLIRNVGARLQAPSSLRPAGLINPEKTGRLSGLFADIGKSLDWLVQSAEQYARRVDRLLEAMPPVVLLVSSDQRILWANRSYQEKFGVSASQVVGQPLGSVPPFRGDRSRLPSDEERISSSIRCLRSTCKDGERVFLATWIDCAPAHMTGLHFGIVLEEIADRRRLHLLLDRVTDSVLIIDEQNRIAGLNQAAQLTLQRSRDELAGLPLEALLLRDASTTPEGQLGALLYPDRWQRNGATLEVTLVKKDGTVLPTTVSIGEYPSSSGCLLLLSFRDESQDRKAEMLARSQMELIELISKNRPLEESLYALALMLQGQIAGSACVVMLRKGDRLHPFVAPQLPESYTQALIGMPIGPSVASCGTAAFEGKLVVVQDIASDPLWADYRDLACRHGLRTCWSAPIHTSSGVLVGTLGIYLRESVQPTAAHAELLQMAARLAAVAIEHRQMTDLLTHEARYDHLTGLPNRPAFRDRFKRAIARSKRSGRAIGVLSVDLDRFKVVNDTLGHAVGDGLLRQIARRLESMVRETDVVARWGGDEFVVGLLDLNDPEDADLVARKLIDGLNSPFEVDGHVLSQTATIGLSTYPKDGEDLASLLRRADRALYRGKRQGRNTFQRSSAGSGGRDDGPFELEAELSTAMERGELTLHYQPQFDAHSGNLLGAEALLRWFHPRLGMIPPDQFIPIAEEGGLIVPIGTWVLEQACQQLSAWRRKGCNVGTVAVNVSLLQFSRPDFVDTVAEVLTEAGLEPRLLEIEVTESILMRDIDASTRCAAKLKDLGVRVTLDDFGTGYSSLGYLQHFPIDNLKLDQSFVRDIGQTRNSELLISSVVELAQNLGIHTTAEGIENVVQLRAIRTTRCDRVQGYLLGKPVPASELSAFGSEYAATATESFVPTALPPRRDSGISQRTPLGGPVPVTAWVDPRLRLGYRNTVTGLQVEKVV